MVYYRRYGSRSYGTKRFAKRSYGRARYGGKKWFNRNNKSAYQMSNTQNVQITVTSTSLHTIANGKSGNLEEISLGTLLTNSEMHKAMGNVYDQFRIRKITAKFVPAGTGSTTGEQYYTFFTVLDRNGFPSPIPDVTKLQTYSSYKQTVYSNTATNKAPTHWFSIENNTLFEKSRYFSTKKVPYTTHIVAGTYLPANTAAQRIISYSVVYNFDITYRGVRMDDSAIANELGMPE